ncbi:MULTISPECIES: fumarylacetoacetate hydrolase family protein [Nocardia]|uniref:fumarylacetoacetate hydrolase family protein n=1 Tax=Nocardia TaxID=1817 RepID=UPI001E3F5019|nr:MULTISPECIES: fumarylacetoacetate hydrolase family protein [Nocardia]
MTARVRPPVADDDPFGPDHLPYGVFAPPGRPFRVGVRLGAYVLDIAALLDDSCFAQPTVNDFLARGPLHWHSVRERLREAARGPLPAEAIHSLDSVRLKLPISIGDYVDFYASIDHATRLGGFLRPNGEALLPNWRHLPVGYHGRAGSVVVSGTPVRRPFGQRRTGSGAPEFAPSARLDIEAELGFVVGVGSEVGTSIAVDDFADHVFGVALVNDWSARDIQAWEGQPLGPFLGKSFATSMAAWITPLAALEFARIAVPEQTPEPLSYLRGQQDWGFDIDVRVHWNGVAVSAPPYRAMYWSAAQMLAHLTVNGAGTRSGDLFASGTISGPGQDQSGSFIELSGNGAHPVDVGGCERTFLADGDTVLLTATAPGPRGARIALGEVSGEILPARR